MNNLVNKNFVIDKETGDIRISQKKCAEILGISQSSLSRYITNASPITFFSVVKHFAMVSKAKNKKSAHVLEYIISCKNFTLNELESDDFKHHMLKFNSNGEFQDESDTKKSLELMDEFFNNLSVDEFLADYLEVEYFEGVTVDELIAYTNRLGRVKGSEHNSKEAKLLIKHGNLK